MRYRSKSAISYMFRNFWRLVPIALPFSIVLGVFYNFVAESDFVFKLAHGAINADNFVAEFTSAYTVAGVGRHWYLPFVVLVLMALTESVFVVKISRHMRVGELSGTSPGQVFALLPTMLLYVAVMFVCKAVLDFLPSGVALMLNFVDNLAVKAAICIVCYYAVSLAVAFVFTLLICAFPLKYCDNYSFGTALSCSARFTSKDKRFVVGFMFLYPGARLLVSVVGGLIGSVVVSILLQTLYFTFFAVYVPCVAFVKYYEYVGRPRQDLSSNVYWN